MLAKTEPQPEPQVSHVDYASDVLSTLPDGKEPAEYLCELGSKRGNPLYSYFEHNAQRGLELYNLGLARHLIATVYRKWRLQENQKQARAEPQTCRRLRDLSTFVRHPETGKLAREADFSKKEIKGSLLHEAQVARGSLERILVRTQHAQLPADSVEQSLQHLDEFIEQMKD